MIDIKTLTAEDVGRWVEYHPNLTDIKIGRIKEWNGSWIFIVFHCEDKWHNFLDYTAQAVSPMNLIFANNPCRP